jgi:hypothetical protein
MAKLQQRVQPVKSLSVETGQDTFESHAMHALDICTTRIPACFPAKFRRLLLQMLCAGAGGSGLLAAATCAEEEEGRGEEEASVRVIIAGLTHHASYFRTETWLYRDILSVGCAELWPVAGTQNQQRTQHGKQRGVDLMMMGKFLGVVVTCHFS